MDISPDFLSENTTIKLQKRLADLRFVHMTLKALIKDGKLAHDKMDSIKIAHTSK